MRRFRRELTQLAFITEETAMTRAHAEFCLVLAAGLLFLAPVAAFAASAGDGSTLGRSLPGRSASEPACPPFPGANAFVNRIDNAFMPLIPGTSYIFQGTEGGNAQRDVVEVTSETKTILGVEAVVVNDTVTDQQGNLIEQTLDWFAQDRAGNVWYMGEDSKAYEHGQVVSTEGSWQAGVDGAQPGMIMEAHPAVGDFSSQECAPGVAEDQAKVLDLTASVKSPYGDFGHALLTRETTPLEPGTAENKYYAQCVGLVRSVDVKGGNAESSLVAVKHGPTPAEVGCKSDGQGEPHDGHDRHHRRHDGGHRRHRAGRAGNRRHEAARQ
jgi:hypothetical protein